MKEFQIYLCGKMSGLNLRQMNEWRITLKDALDFSAKTISNVKVNIVNPVDYYNFENPTHQSEFEVMQFDLNKVKKSDIVIANTEGLNTSIGSAIEIYEANKRDIPVIMYDPKHEYWSVHPWLKECTSRVETTIDDLVQYVAEYYLR